MSVPTDRTAMPSGVPSAPPLDDRDALAFLTTLLARRPGYLPQWQPPERGAEVAVLQAVARYLQTIAQRLNQSPDKSKLAFLDLLGVRLVTAQAARVPVVFRLAPDAADIRMPAGTRLAAAPPPGSSAQITFETERSTGLGAARLNAAVSLWPGRDQYIDHSAVLLAGQPIQPFQKRALQNTPHVLYIAHDTLLALTGKSDVSVRFDLTTPGNTALSIRWQYWDGKIWRDFKAMLPACTDGTTDEKLDGTDGLQRSGAFRLETDGAETAKTTVGGIEAFWVRGVLTETLPPDPARVLPEVETIQIGTTISRPLAVDWQTEEQFHALNRRIQQPLARVTDASGAPMRGVQVALLDANGVETPDSGPTNLAGNLPPPEGDTSAVKAIRVSLGDYHKQQALARAAATETVAFALSIKGLTPDKALANDATLDLTKTFYPLGAQPQPGDAFYFTHMETFSKPGAHIRFFIQPALTPQEQALLADASNALGSALQHTLAWEYWNGDSWKPLLIYTNPVTAPGAEVFEPDPSTPDDFSGAGFVDLTVPDDMAITKVGGQDGLWMRVRLVSGGFGVTRTVSFTVREESRSFSYFVSQPPALSAFCLGYIWQQGPVFAEHVLAFNDFQYLDRTEEAKWPGKTFQPFTPVGDVTPALYLGFNKPLPVDDDGIFFDVVEQRGDSEGPLLRWEYWDGFAWQNVIVDDGSRNLRIPGLATFIGPDDSQALARFDAPLFWLRARLNEDGPPGAPTINGIYPHAVWAVQHQTLTDEPLGVSTGQPDQVFAFRSFPVLPGERVEVREVAGARAHIEWRLIAADLFANDPRVLESLETELGREGTQTEVTRGPLRLVRDRTKQVTEVWVQWREADNLFSAGPHDRVYQVDRARGRLLLPDETGFVPPAGAAITARSYRTGGGAAGNVAAQKITQVLGPVGGVEKVYNPRPAEGGADTETLAALAQRGPFTVRHRGRAIAPGDYETLAKEASPDVAVARAIPCRDPSGRDTPGWVTLVLIPESAEDRPYPSFGLRQSVQQFVTERAAADLTAAKGVVVTGPDYRPVDVEAVLVPRDPQNAGAVEQGARDALRTFLHPLRGGPEGHGWTPGRSIYLSDVASALERVDGMDYVKELALLRDGVPQGESLQIGADQTVVAGDLRLKVTEV